GRRGSIAARGRGRGLPRGRRRRGATLACQIGQALVDRRQHGLAAALLVGGFQLTQRGGAVGREAAHLFDQLIGRQVLQLFDGRRLRHVSALLDTHAMCASSVENRLPPECGDVVRRAAARYTGPTEQRQLGCVPVTGRG